METFPVDLDPGQILRWIRAEQRASPSKFRISASRTTELRDIPLREEFRLGDEEREDLTDVATVATLDIEPFHAVDGWRLTLVAEDQAGPRALATSRSLAGEAEIDLDLFYRDFVASGRSAINVTATVETAVAKARLARILDRIETNRHAHRDPAA